MRVAELQALAPQLHQRIERYGASNLAVFGSVARDQARPVSHIDLRRSDGAAGLAIALQCGA